VTQFEVRGREGQNRRCRQSTGPVIHEFQGLLVGVIPYQLTIEAHPTYLHARVSGERTPENALRFLKEVFEACVRTGHSSALLEMQFSGPSLATGDIFRVISQRSPEGAALRRIAYVEASMSDPAKARFAETVATNRAVNVRLFTDVVEAARWLGMEAN
jgi:hypothetical protein